MIILVLSEKYTYVIKKGALLKIYGRDSVLVQQDKLLQQLKNYLVENKFLILLSHRN